MAGQLSTRVKLGDSVSNAFSVPDKVGNRKVVINDCTRLSAVFVQRRIAAGMLVPLQGSPFNPTRDLDQ